MLPFYDLYPHRVERVTFVRHAVKHPRPALTLTKLVKASEIITKMSRKLFFLLSPSAVLFYFLFTVRVPHKKTINLLFTDHQEIVSRRGLFTTHVRLVAESPSDAHFTIGAPVNWGNDTFYLYGAVKIYRSLLVHEWRSERRWMAQTGGLGELRLGCKNGLLGQGCRGTLHKWDCYDVATSRKCPSTY